MPLPKPLRGPLARAIADHWLGDRARRGETERFLDRMSLRGVAKEALVQLEFGLGVEHAWVTPRAVRFEVTNSCNLKCLMCPQPEVMQRPKRHLDFDLYRRFLEANPSIEEVDLFNWGEPLLHPRICDFVSEATSRGLYTRFVTNAVLLDERRSEALIRAGLKELHFSFDGTGKEYERIRGIPVTRPLQNVRGFLATSERLGAQVRTSINLTRSKWNEERIEEMAKELAECGVDTVLIQPSEEYSAAYRRSAPCFEPYRYLVVLSDARVVPCCVDFDGELAFGSIAEELDLRRLYNTPSMRLLRKRLKSADTMPTLCSRCTFRLPAAERPLPPPAPPQRAA